MIIRKKNRGGARPGAGRKPDADPKYRLQIRVEQSIIDDNGGVTEAETEAYNFLKKRAIKRNK